MGELIGGVVTDDLRTAVLWTSNESGFGLQKVEGDRRDTETMVLAPYHGARMQGLKKLIIEAPLSEKVSQTIVRHPGLREINFNSMLGINPGLLAKAVTKLETLKVAEPN